jgi:hypothetical protein
MSGSLILYDGTVTTGQDGSIEAVGFQPKQTVQIELIPDDFILMVHQNPFDQRFTLTLAEKNKPISNPIVSTVYQAIYSPSGQLEQVTQKGLGDDKNTEILDAITSMKNLSELPNVLRMSADQTTALARHSIFSQNAQSPTH